MIEKEKKTTIKVSDESKLDSLLNKYKGKDVEIELTEEDGVNPWAICNKTVTNKNKVKFEACVKSIKKEHNLDEEVIDDADNFINLLSTKFSTQLKKINTPSEKANLIIKFAELLDVPSNKIGEIVSSIKDLRNDNLNNSLNENKLEIIINKIIEDGE